MASIANKKRGGDRKRSILSRLASNLQAFGTCLVVLSFVLSVSCHDKKVFKGLGFRNDSEFSEDFSLNRTLILQYFHPTNIFEQYHSIPDTLVFSGIGELELNKLSDGNIVASTSSEQIRNGWISTRFIILEEPWHFQRICSKTTGRVHWLHFEKEPTGLLRWVQSRGEMSSSFKEFLLQRKYEVSEAVLFENLVVGNHELPPVCITGSQAVDNSRYLSNVGNKLRHIYPERNVTSFRISELVNKIKHSNATNEENGVLSVLRDELGITNNLTRVELLLDAFQELDSREDVDLGYQVLETITSGLTTVRLWVATSMEENDLEGSLGVPCYKLKPLSEYKQIGFLVSYWSKNETLDLERLSLFAEESIKALNSEGKPKLKEIFDQSLQTLLLAEVYEGQAIAYAQLNGTRNSTETPEFPIKTVAQLYEAWINKKLGSYKGYSENDDQTIIEKGMRKMFTHLGLEAVFPGRFENLKRSVNPAMEVIKIGKLNTRSGPILKHPTISDYFVARFVMERLKSEDDWEEDDFTEFLVEGVLGSQPIKLEGDGGNISSIDTFQFSHPSIAYFINEFLKSYQNLSNVRINNATTTINRISDRFPESIREIPHSCANSDLYAIFQFFHHHLNAFGNETSGIFDKDLVTVATLKSSLEFIKIVVTQFKKQCKLQSDILHKAVRRGSFPMVEHLLQDEQLRQIVMESNQTLLHECIQGSKLNEGLELTERIKVVRFLVGLNGKLLEERDEEKATPILVRDVSVQILTELVNLGADVLARNSKNESVLHINSNKLTNEEYHWLVMNIPKNKLRKLVQVRDNSGRTPLSSTLQNMDPTPGTLQRFNSVGANFRSTGNDKNCTYYEARCSLLGFAISNGRNLATIRKLIDCGADFAWRQSNGRSLLHLAAFIGRTEVVEFFIRGYWINQKVEDKSGLTALDMAIQSGCGSCYQTGMFLKELSTKFSKDQWPLHKAAQEKHPSSIKLLINLGMTVDEVDKEGNTPLHRGAQCADHPNCFSTIRLLLDSNANPNAVNSIGETPFQIALNSSALEFETFQLLKSKTVMRWTQSIATRALVSLVRNGNVERFRSLALELRSYGADLNYKEGAHEISLLHLAAISGNEKAALFLLENGANVNVTDKLHNTPLHYSIGSLRMIKLFINSGANVAVKNDRQATFLHEYLKQLVIPSPSQFHSLVVFLVERNHTDLFTTLGEGPLDTPYQLAVNRVKPYEGTLSLLLSNGVDEPEPSSVPVQVVSGSSSNRFDFWSCHSLIIIYLFYFTC